MKTIWKYVLSPLGTYSIPRGAKVLAAREQQDRVCIWVLVDPDEVKELRTFVVVGTGCPVPDGNLEYLGMAHLRGGEYVFHIFESLPNGTLLAH